jgi:ankyrin repeat protein
MVCIASMTHDLASRWSAALLLRVTASVLFCALVMACSQEYGHVSQSDYQSMNPFAIPHMDPAKVFHDPRVVKLAKAVADGDSADIRQLAREGVDLNAHGNHDINLLEWAIYHGSRKGFEALLDAGADPENPGLDDPKNPDAGDDPVILMAAWVKDPAYLRMLIDHGVDVSKPRGKGGQTPLMASLGPESPQFDMLLKAGADPNVRNVVGDTALIFAAGDYSEALALLKAGADPRARNDAGNTFQRYLRMQSPDTMTEQGKHELAEIDAWLRAHDVPIEPAPSS